MKKVSLLFIALLISMQVFAQETPTKKEETAKKLATALDIVYVGMPKEDLYKTGFTEYLQKSYRKDGQDEWITFLDYTTEENGDLITFHLVDGKIAGWEKPKKEVVIPKI